MVVQKGDTIRYSSAPSILDGYKEYRINLEFSRIDRKFEVLVARMSLHHFEDEIRKEIGKMKGIVTIRVRGGDTWGDCVKWEAFYGKIK